MKTYNGKACRTIVSISGLLGALLLVEIALAQQQPPDIVGSDAYLNTAMGTSALLDLEPDSVNQYGIADTAAGYWVLLHNTIGSNNTGLGYTALYVNTTGSANTAVGSQALEENISGCCNSAFGAGALLHNTTGNDNTATGTQALYSNTVGVSNTASGLSALANNQSGSNNTAVGSLAMSGVAGTFSSGSNNTAVGANALSSHSTGADNTAIGYEALHANSTGTNNSALGNGALQYNVEGTDNTALGDFSLYLNKTGNYNAACGSQTLFSSTSASNNTASGYRAMYKTTTGTNNAATGFGSMLSNTTGTGNTAVGYNALALNTTGLTNIAIGDSAGYSVTGSNNIDIGSLGVAGESDTIRIGSNSQKAVYFAGITSTHLAGSPVYVSNNGQLGVLASSERYKTDVESMQDYSAKLTKLHPVSYRLKNDPEAGVQYGLIAEEVNRVLPELVIRDGSGEIQGVRYDELAPILLNQLQMESSQRHAMQHQIDALRSELKEVSKAMKSSGARP